LYSGLCGHSVSVFFFFLSANRQLERSGVQLGAAEGIMC
jgi:hypothetical protein